MTPRVPTLSKGRFTAGLQCTKRLYLEWSAPELRDPEDPGRQALARTGAEIGALARGRFPGGVLVDGQGRFEEAVDATRRLLGDPTVPAIFEGAFEHAGARIRADVMLRVAPGLFDLIEVKSGSRLREHHETDLALQLAVVSGAGFGIRRAQLLLVSRDYVHPGGSVDLDHLFTPVDLTEQARGRVPTVLARVAAMVRLLDTAAVPAVATGAHCVVPYRCPFFGHCHAGGPLHPLTDLPRLTPEQLAALLGAGIDDIRRVPPDFPGLTPVQIRACAAVVSGLPFRDPAVGERLAAIPLPAHFVDFETFAPAVPVYPGTRPFEQVPFQWSDHVLDADGRVTHHEFLHDADGDPRESFARSLLAATAGAAALVVYSSFEGDVLAALAAELPHLAPELAARRARIVDLLPIVREHCYHPALRGSFSIKSVLPAFVPGLSYEGLAIRDGLTASLSHAALVDPTTPPERRAELRRQLLAYCARDTEAMLALYRVLGAPV